MNKMKVLVVDGSKQDRRMVVEALLDLTNVIVFGAVPDLDGALRALEHDLPDVIVTDALPDGGCAELIEAARRHDPAPAIAVFTGTDSDEQRRLCVGADLYIHKDAGLQELQLGVRDLARARAAAIRERRGDPFRTLGRLTAGIAHDLNNYLAVLTVSFDMIRRRQADPGVWDRARAALDAATAMTRNLLAYARGGVPEPELVDLGAVARSTASLVEGVAPHGVIVSVDVDDVLPAVTGVASELEQVVLNLVLNAYDAMPHGGEVRIAVRADGEKVTLEVADTGHGVGDQVRFATGTLTPSSKRRGAGLGLGIVRAVAERHRAELLIAPRAGGGTTVTITLDAAL
jgi:signal transduction histidine kinase